MKNELSDYKIRAVHVCKKNIETLQRCLQARQEIIKILSVPNIHITSGKTTAEEGLLQEKQALIIWEKRASAK